MEPNPAPLHAAATRGGRDVNRALARREKIPKRRRTYVTQDRPFPAGKHRRHPSRLLRKGAVTDGIDPTMESMQSSCPHPAGHAAAIHPSHGKLPRGDHPMLGESDLGYLAIERVDFLSHTDTKSTRPGDSPPAVVDFGWL